MLNSVAIGAPELSSAQLSKSLYTVYFIPYFNHGNTLQNNGMIM